MLIYSPNLEFLGTDSSLYYNSYELKSDHGWSSLVNLIDVLNMQDMTLLIFVLLT